MPLQGHVVNNLCPCTMADGELLLVHAVCTTAALSMLVHVVCTTSAHMLAATLGASCKPRLASRQCVQEHVVCTTAVHA